MGLSGAVRREERWTISYLSENNADFSQGLLSPISVETLVLIARTGWAWGRILRCTVQNLNQVDNATSAGGPTPARKPDYETFRYVTQLLRQLQIEQVVELAQAERSNRQEIPVRVDEVTDGFVMHALERGGEFRQSAAGDWHMYRPEMFAAMILGPAALDSPELGGLLQLLGLAPGRTVYELEPAKNGQLRTAAARPEAL